MAELTQNHKVQKNWIVVIAIILIASTLRAPLTSVGPVIHEIKEAMSINDSIAGFLTTIPLIIFAIVSPLV
ncbi:MFS transporter, partial [Staphylococcus epidermidis]